MHAGRHAEARQRLLRCIEVHEGSGRALDPSVTEAYALLAGVQAELGELDAAAATGRLSLAHYERVEGASHLSLGLPLLNLGVVLDAQGDTAQARVLWTRALGIIERRLGSSHPAILLPLLNLAGAAVAEGDPAGALAQVRRGWVAVHDAYGPEHAETAMARCQMAETMLDQSHPTVRDARMHAQAAMAVLEHAMPGAHPDTLECAVILARASALDGMFDRARALLSQVESNETDPRITPGRRALLLINAAAVHNRLGDAATANSLLARAGVLAPLGIHQREVQRRLRLTRAEHNVNVEPETDLDVALH